MQTTKKIVKTIDRQIESIDSFFKSKREGYICKNWRDANESIKKFFRLLQKKYKLINLVKLLEPENNVNDQFLLNWIVIDSNKLPRDYLISKLEKSVYADIKFNPNNGLIYCRFFDPKNLLKIFEIVYNVKKEKVPA